MKKLKGMTLVELVISIAILSYASLMLLLAMAQVSMINRENHQLNERISSQVKVAENESQTFAGASQKTDGEVRIEVKGGGGVSSATYTLEGRTIYIQTAGDSIVSEDDINFKYFVADP